jgi:muconolactone delta-isomerase
MEYLVTMTTHVPQGVSDAEVAAIRDREAAHARELASEGRLLRLWRPPLEPGEWRTLGLFDAADKTTLDAVLRSMPLRVWRTDDVVPLASHPNDPGRDAAHPVPALPEEGSSEYFTTFDVTIPPDTPARVTDEAQAEESARTRQLAGQGALQRLWTLPGAGRALGLWRVRDPDAMRAILESLPLRVWFSVETLPLSPHPSDPASSVH